MARAWWIVPFLLAACGQPEAERLFPGSGWDTTLVIGSMSAEDSTLLSPEIVVAWGELLAVDQGGTEQVSVFDRSSGRLRWVYGRRGQGPGEVAQVGNLFIDADNHLRVRDSRNKKVLKLSTEGAFLGEQSTQHIPMVSSDPALSGETLFWSQLWPGRPAYLTDVAELEVVDSLVIEWPIPDNLPRAVRISARNRGLPDGWVTALDHGPWFAVIRPADVRIHSYVQSIPFTYRNGPWKALDPMGDTATYGAQDISVVDDEIFMLFGGRPLRFGNPEEPTNLIDVYGVDGGYRRSYQLPFDTDAMATVDGRTFYVLTLVERMYPHLFGLTLTDDN